MTTETKFKKKEKYILKKCFLYKYFYPFKISA